MIVDCAVYQDGRRRAGSLPLVDALEASREDHSFVWLGLYEPTLQELGSVREEFDLHELAAEDALKAHQRPKVERYGDSLFVVLKTCRYDETSEGLLFGEVQAFLGDRFLITVRHGDTALHDVRLDLEQRPFMLKSGVSAALHAIVDKVVDDYLPVMEALHSEIRAVEAEVFSPARSNPAERIYKLKRQVLALDEAISPLPDELARLTRGHDPLIPEEMVPYFRDVHDHLLRVATQIESFSDLLASALTANLTQISVRQNEDMRRISAWAAIIAVPTMVAGIYGMNFEHMPELGWAYSYPFVIALVVATCVLLYLYFRRIGWL